MIRGILFDLDGVLVDSEVWNKAAFNATLSLANLPTLNSMEYAATLGLNSTKQFELLGELRDFSFDIEGLTKVKRQLTLKAIEQHCWPNCRVSSVVTWAISHFDIGIVTNCSKETASAILGRASLDDYFDVVVTNSDVKKTKPAPDPYLLGCKRLGWLEEEVLAIDDSDKGVKSATLAGCKVWHLERFDDLTIENLRVRCDK